PLRDGASLAVVLVIVAVLVVFLMRAPQQVAVVIEPDTLPHLVPGILVEAEMNASEDTRVGNVVGDVAQVGVVQLDSGRAGVGDGQAVTPAAVGPLEDDARRAAARTVRRRIPWETGRDDERPVVRVGARPAVAVLVGAPDRGQIGRASWRER